MTNYERLIEAESQGDTPEMVLQARLKVIREILRDGCGDLIEAPARYALSAGESVLRAVQSGDANEAAAAGVTFGAAWFKLKFNAR